MLLLERALCHNPFPQARIGEGDKGPNKATSSKGFALMLTSYFRSFFPFFLMIKAWMQVMHTRSSACLKVHMKQGQIH